MVVTPETLRKLLTMNHLKEYLYTLPTGSIVGIAEDDDTLPGGDWAHKNVIAQYIAVQLSISRVSVDYSGITIGGACEELLYDGSLAWVEYLLMALDAMLAGTHTFQNVSKEQVLAFLDVFTVLENARSLAEEQSAAIPSDKRNGRVQRVVKRLYRLCKKIVGSRRSILR